MKKFEIWIGYCHLGMGSLPTTEPKKVGEEIASSFEIACLKYALRSKLEWLETADASGQYISSQDKEWFYNWRENSSTWIGKYYPSKEEAQKSF